MNPIHYHSINAPSLPKVPPNSPEPYKRAGANQNIDPDYVNMVSGISEDLLGTEDIDKAEGQGKTKPIPVPQKKQEWNNQHFGD